MKYCCIAGHNCIGQNNFFTRQYIFFSAKRKKLKNSSLCAQHAAASQDTNYIWMVIVQHSQWYGFLAVCIGIFFFPPYNAMTVQVTRLYIVVSWSWIQVALLMFWNLCGPKLFSLPPLPATISCLHAIKLPTMKNWSWSKNKGKNSKCPSNFDINVPSPPKLSKKINFTPKLCLR